MDENKKEILNEEMDLTATVESHFHGFNSSDYREQYIEDYNHCCLCGSELEFVHVAHFISNEVCEEAFCPSCKVRTKKHMHRLQ